MTWRQPSNFIGGSRGSLLDNIDLKNSINSTYKRHCWLKILSKAAKIKRKFSNQ